MGRLICSANLCCKIEGMPPTEASSPIHASEAHTSCSRTSQDLNNGTEISVCFEGNDDREEEPTEAQDEGEEQSTENVDTPEGSDRDIELEERLEMIKEDCNEHEKMIIGGVIIPSEKFGFPVLMWPSADRT